MPGISDRSEHESDRSEHESDRNEHESDRSEHESDRSEHESNRSEHESDRSDHELSNTILQPTLMYVDVSTELALLSKMHLYRLTWVSLKWTMQRARQDISMTSE